MGYPRLVRKLEIANIMKTQLPRRPNISDKVDFPPLEFSSNPSLSVS